MLFLSGLQRAFCMWAYRTGRVNHTVGCRVEYDCNNLPSVPRFVRNSRIAQKQDSEIVAYDTEFSFLRTVYLTKNYRRQKYKSHGLDFPSVRCTSHSFPLPFYMEDKHEGSRFKRCIVFGKQVPGEKYRKSLARDTKKDWDWKQRCVLLSRNLFSQSEARFPHVQPGKPCPSPRSLPHLPEPQAFR